MGNNIDDSMYVNHKIYDYKYQLFNIGKFHFMGGRNSMSTYHEKCARYSVLPHLYNDYLHIIGNCFLYVKKYNKNVILIDFLTEIANSDVGKYNPQKRIYEAKCLLEMIKSGKNG